MVLLHRAHLVLPVKINALDVLFEFDQMQLAPVDLIGPLDWDHGPAQELAGRQAPFACDEVVLPVDDRGVDQADGLDRLGQLVNAAEFAALSLVTGDDDVGDADDFESS